MKTKAAANEKANKVFIETLRKAAADANAELATVESQIRELEARRKALKADSSRLGKMIASHEKAGY